MKPWCVLFSQTGTEIFNLSKLLERDPDVIITNKPICDLEKINFSLLDRYWSKMYFLNKKPDIEEYMFLLPEHSVITLHGFLRVIPKDVCEARDIYNLHPAPLTLYPDLKGKDPQERVFERHLEYSGNTIHRCTAELDAGEILLEEKFLLERHDLEYIISATHERATQLWYKFLKERL